MRAYAGTIIENGKITLPKEALKISGFKKGTAVAVVTMGDRIALVPARSVGTKRAPR